MNVRNLAALVALLLTAAVPAWAQEAQEAATATAETAHVILDASEIAWQPAPAVLPSGAEIAVLAGDLAKEGPFVFRVKFPDGYRIAPHWHPIAESVTVLSGTFGIGMGETFDPAGERELGPGGLFVMPAEAPHFAWTKGETIIQVHSDGLWALNYVNPADDPRNAAPVGGAPTGR